MSAIPTALPAETLDRILAALAEQRVTGMIHLFLGWPLDAPPADGDRLARAARLLVDAEPILGCRLETGGPRGVQWRRHPDPDAIPWFESLAAPSRGAAIRAVINAEEPPEGRNLILRLIRCEAEARHLLTVSVSHVVADGSAAYDCAYQLAALYNALAGDPAHRLAPNTASRDSYEWMHALSWRHHGRILLRDLAGLRHLRSKPMGMRGPADLAAWHAAPRTNPAFVERRLGPELLGALDGYAVTKGTSRLELLVAALARSFHDLLGPEARPHVRVLLPSNLRRFAPVSRRAAIRNMSGIASMTFPVVRHAPFEATLAAARQEGIRLRRGLAGATNPLGVAALRRMGWTRLRSLLAGVVERGLRQPSPPTFTNVGRINEARLRFDSILPEDAMLLTAAYPMPLLLITGSEFRRHLTLAIGFQEDSMPRARMQALLDGLVAQLPAPQEATA